MAASKNLDRIVNLSLVVVGAAVLLIVVLMFVPVHYSRVVDPGDYRRLRTLYREIKAVPLSRQNNEEIETLIKDRLECYNQSESYQQRTVQCYSRYITGIVAFSRSHIRSNPLLGHFLSEAEACPVIYNICRGSENLSVDRCIDVEQQCIDYMLDKYWRGQGYLIEF